MSRLKAPDTFLDDDLAAADQGHDDVAIDARPAVKRPRRKQHIRRRYLQ
jgi:hypothetical protein